MLQCVVSLGCAYLFLVPALAPPLLLGSVLLHAAYYQCWPSAALALLWAYGLVETVFSAHQLWLINRLCAEHDAPEHRLCLPRLAPADLPALGRELLPSVPDTPTAIDDFLGGWFPNTPRPSEVLRQDRKVLVVGSGLTAAEVLLKLARIRSDLQICWTFRKSSPRIQPLDLPEVWFMDRTRHLRSFSFYGLASMAERLGLFGGSS